MARNKMCWRLGMHITTTSVPWMCKVPQENTETFDAISLLAGKCRTDAKYFGFAGTKDRRGRTTQRCSVSMVSAEQLLGAAKTVRNVEVGSFSYQPAELKLGQV